MSKSSLLASALAVKSGINVNLAYAILACGLASSICLAGCTVQKEWTATGGSRADGTVELAFEYGAFQKPEVNDAQGVDLAASMCSGWGYTGSQPFAPMSKCEAVNGYGNCIRFLVTRQYQCLGAPGSPTAPPAVPVAANPAPVAANSASLTPNPAQVTVNPAPISANSAPAVVPAAAIVTPAPATANPQVGDQWKSSDHDE